MSIRSRRRSRGCLVDAQTEAPVDHANEIDDKPLRGPYRMAQPWGRDKGRDATLISEHSTAADAFEAMERLAEQAQRTGGRIEVLELIVVDAEGRVVARRGVQ